jgi:hypothetical protein
MRIRSGEGGAERDVWKKLSSVPIRPFLRTYIDDDVQSGKHETCMESLIVIYEDQHNDKDLSLPSHYCHCLAAMVLIIQVIEFGSPVVRNVPAALALRSSRASPKTNGSP